MGAVGRSGAVGRRKDERFFFGSENMGELLGVKFVYRPKRQKGFAFRSRAAVRVLTIVAAVFRTGGGRAPAARPAVWGKGVR